MATIVREEKYIKSDVGNNNNKFWTGILYSDNSVETKWGRVGDVGQSKMFPGAGASFLDKKCREKESARNGEIPYRKLNVIGGAQPVASTTRIVSASTSQLADVAKKQIQTNNPIVNDLITYLAKKNVHNLVDACGDKLTYNDTTGLFSTPLGVVTQENIDSARDILTKIADLVAESRWDREMADFTNSYCMLIPQNIGHRRLETREFWSDLSKIQRQSQILDGLQASVVTASQPAKSMSVNVPEEKVFNVELNLVTDRNVVREVFDYYTNTKSTMHGCCRYSPKQMWEVKISNMLKAFDSRGKALGNVVSGFHGTGSENVLSLLKSGFLTRPPSSAKVSGKLFGCGTYCAPLKRVDGRLVKGAGTKALAYATGGWGGSVSERTFMFFVEMAMGKFYVPSYRNYQSINYPVNGYDSTWAYGETMNGRNDYSGVMNDEAIVYKEHQVNIKYLVEFV